MLGFLVNTQLKRISTTHNPQPVCFKEKLGFNLQLQRQVHWTRNILSKVHIPLTYCLFKTHILKYDFTGTTLPEELTSPLPPQQPLLKTMIFLFLWTCS